jgi:hypothetical protein
MDAVLTRAHGMITEGKGVRLLIVGEPRTGKRSAIEEVLQRCEGFVDVAKCVVRASSGMYESHMDAVRNACESSGSCGYGAEGFGCPPGLATRTVVVLHCVSANLTQQEACELCKIMDSWPEVSFMATSTVDSVYPEMLDRFVVARAPRAPSDVPSLELDDGSEDALRAARSFIARCESENRVDCPLIACRALVSLHRRLSRTDPDGAGRVLDAIEAVHDMSSVDVGYSNRPSLAEVLALIVMVRNAADQSPRAHA